MIKIALNIGYSSPNFGGSILNTFPFMWEFNSVRECFDWIRTQAFNFLTWSYHQHVPKSSMCLYLYMEDEENFWEYKIMCANIREYKAIMSYTREDIEVKMRESTIDSILIEEKTND